MCYYTLLWHDYDSYCNYCNYDTVLTILSRWSEQFLSKKLLVWATHLGYHVGEESQLIDRLVRSMTWTWSSWDLHTVSQPTSCVCDECPWHGATQTRSYSGSIWSPMILATVLGLRVSLFPHLDACRESRCQWFCCNFSPVTQSIPIAPGSKLELNTTQEEYA